MHQYKLLFSGELVEGKTREQVQSQAIKALKLTEKTANHLFNPDGKAVVIKKVASIEDANLFCKKFRNLGMILDIKASEPVAESPAQNTAAAKPAINNSVNDLSLVPVTPKPAVPEQIAETTEHDESPETASRIREFMYSLLSYLRPSLFLLIIGLALLLSYSPHSDGFLRKGFIVGLLLFYLGVRGIRSRA